MEEQQQKINEDVGSPLKEGGILNNDIHHIKKGLKKGLKKGGKNV